MRSASCQVCQALEPWETSCCAVTTTNTAANHGGRNQTPTASATLIAMKSPCRHAGSGSAIAGHASATAWNPAATTNAIETRRGTRAAEVTASNRSAYRRFDR